jgi:hypothetical protein
MAVCCGKSSCSATTAVDQPRLQPVVLRIAVPLAEEHVAGVPQRVDEHGFLNVASRARRPDAADERMIGIHEPHRRGPAGVGHGGRRAGPRGLGRTAGDPGRGRAAVRRPGRRRLRHDQREDARDDRRNAATHDRRAPALRCVGHVAGFRSAGERL